MVIEAYARFVYILIDFVIVVDLENGDREGGGVHSSFPFPCSHQWLMLLAGSTS